MRTLITGGCGFIGSRLVASLLERDGSIVILDNLSPQIHGNYPSFQPSWRDDPRVSLIRGDVRSLEVVDRALDGVDGVVHLAAETGTGQSMYEIAHYNSVNSQATALLLERVAAAKSSVRKIVLASSRSIYGEGSYVCDACSPNEIYTPPPRQKNRLELSEWEPHCPKCSQELRAVPTREDALIRPASIYAATKSAQEDLVRIASEASDIPAIALRFQNVYGEGQSLKNPYTGIISIFSTRLRRQLSLPVYEDGQESRDFVHVDDVVDALTSALTVQHSGYRVFNIGSGIATSVLELANVLARVMGYKVEPVVTGEFRVGDIRHCFADIAAATKELGFTPKIKLEDGLHRFAKWALSEPLPEDQLERAAAELKAHGLMSQRTI